MHLFFRAKEVDSLERQGSIKADERVILNLQQMTISCMFLFVMSKFLLEFNYSFTIPLPYYKRLVVV